MHIAIWILALLALGLWSLAAWGTAWVLGLDPNWVGSLKPLIEQIPYASVIDTWVPGWQELMVGLIDLTRMVLGWIGGAGTVVVWILWVLGALVIVGCAALTSLAVVLIRRGARAASPAGRPA